MACFWEGCHALIALGLTLMFGVMRVVNFAHGDFLMLAMYGTFFAWSLMGVDPACIHFLYGAPDGA